MWRQPLSEGVSTDVGVSENRGPLIFGNSYVHLGGCQNYDPFLGTPNIRCSIVTRTQQGTLILTTTHLLHTKFSGASSLAPSSLGLDWPASALKALPRMLPQAVVAVLVVVLLVVVVAVVVVSIPAQLCPNSGTHFCLTSSA